MRKQTDLFGFQRCNISSGSAPVLIQFLLELSFVNRFEVYEKVRLKFLSNVNNDITIAETIGRFVVRRPGRSTHTTFL